MRNTLKAVAVATICGLSCTTLAWSQNEPEQPTATNATTANTTAPEAGNTTAANATAEDEETKIEFKGYFSQSYSVNTNDPASGFNQFRTYDFKDRDFKFDLFNLNTQYGVDKKGEAGFRLDLTAGASHPQVDAALGLFRGYNSGLSTTQFDVRQAFVTYTSEGGIRADVGKFATPIGYEVMDGVDGANPNATRSWAFQYGPFTHTGARVAIPIGDQITATALIVNGWDQWRDANSSISLGGQILYKPSDNFNIAFNYITGPERFGNNTSNRRLFDVTANWKVHEKINLGFNAISGVDDDFISAGVPGAWNGMSFYMQNELHEKFNLNFRYEAFNDPVGTRTGVGQRLRGFTITPEYRINDNWMIRADLRFDTSDQTVYDTNNGAALSKQQTTFMFNNVVKF